MNDWRDPDRVQADLTPTDIRPPDSNMYCFHQSGEIYAVLSLRKWRRLRRQGQLDSFLEQERESGVVITRGQGQ